MCIVCQNIPALMTGLSGTGLVIRTVVRRTRADRTRPAGDPTVSTTRSAETAATVPAVLRAMHA